MSCYAAQIKCNESTIINNFCVMQMNSSATLLTSQSVACRISAGTVAKIASLKYETIEIIYF